jgi:transcription initiation factor TFIID subunit TAF12
MATKAQKHQKKYLFKKPSCLSVFVANFMAAIFMPIKTRRSVLHWRPRAGGQQNNGKSAGLENGINKGRQGRTFGKDKQYTQQQQDHDYGQQPPLFTHF